MIEPPLTGGQQFQIPRSQHNASNKLPHSATGMVCLSGNNSTLCIAVGMWRMQCKSILMGRDAWHVARDNMVYKDCVHDSPDAVSGMCPTWLQTQHHGLCLRGIQQQAMPYKNLACRLNHQRTYIEIHTVRQAISYAVQPFTSTGFGLFTYLPASAAVSEPFAAQVLKM